MYDLIIKNGKVIDGTGKTSPQDLDIGIKGNLISEIGNLKKAKAREIIDAQGDYVTPGFIDVQNHSDSYWTIFDYPGQESMLTQGITTISVGQCGASLAPLPSLEGFKAVQKWRSAEGENINWQYMEEYLEILSRQKLGVNVLTFVGHSTMRRGLLGDDIRKLSESELKVLERVTTSSLKSGAFGLSFGLVYAHEYNSSKEELLRLAKLATQHGRSISMHIRNDQSHILEAIDEAIDLSQESGARLKISHLKIRGRENWHLADQVIERLDQTHKKGLNVRFDLYPYTTSWPVLYTYLPKWSYEGGKSELNKRLAQPYLREKIINSLHEQNQDLSNIIIATSTGSPHLIGKDLSEIARAQEVTAAEALLNVLSSSMSEVVVFDENISWENLEQFIKHPLGMIATNGAGFQTKKINTKNLIHPRCFGAMPRYLNLVLYNKWLSPQKAIHKITGMPAEYLGLKNRGVIKKGSIADIAVFDPNGIRDLATLPSPYQVSEGISAVVLGGELALSGGRVIARKFGQVLRA